MGENFTSVDRKCIRISEGGGGGGGRVTSNFLCEVWMFFGVRQ